MTYLIKTIDLKTNKRSVRFRCATKQEAEMWLRWIDRFEPQTYPTLTFLPQGARHKKINRR